MARGFNHFSKLADAFPEVAKKIVRKTGFDAEAAIKQRIRANGQIDTGNMVNGVYHNSSDSSTYRGGKDPLPEVTRPTDPYTTRIGVAASYGIYQNYGTRYQIGRPFFEPGMEDVRPGFEGAIAAFENALKDEM